MTEHCVDAVFLCYLGLICQDIAVLPAQGTCHLGRAIDSATTISLITVLTVKYVTSLIVGVICSRCLECQTFRKCEIKGCICNPLLCRTVVIH